ncbi:50S ribosomal protein [Parasponia andersonii]|uniref:50S ribosomal protein n=1 Tax=Parasponia andersonii TaxID=3476 RepID=A0A2P5E598_PARAD|nr:50S ribosomal protein [Parasponia andersonii]
MGLLLLCSSGLTLPSITCASKTSSFSSRSLSLTLASIAAPISELNLLPKSCVGVGFGGPTTSVGNKRGTLIAKASSGIPDGGDDDDAQSESDDDADLPVDELGLDAKLLNKLEKKLKMKVAKKIRLRRKKLVHKRRLRKKGRWPPSKMKKLSNV